MQSVTYLLSGTHQMLSQHAQTDLAPELTSVRKYDRKFHNHRKIINSHIDACTTYSPCSYLTDQLHSTITVSHVWLAQCHSG